MKNAELRVIKFDKTDVIATSTFTLSGIGNGICNDATLTINGKTYKNEGRDGTNDVSSALEKAFNDAYSAYDADAFENINFDRSGVNFGGGSALNNIIYYDSGNDTKTGDTSALNVFNGTWKLVNGTFVKQ